MKQKNLLWGMVLIVALVAIGYMFTGGENEDQYQETVKSERERQFKYLKFNDESPLTPKQKRELDSLDYFPIDRNYRVRARMVPVRNQVVLEIPMTDGSIERYIKHSLAEFEMGGETRRLLLLQATDELDKKKFFLPFADETSGETTYGGGRYLNVRQDGVNSITIDFNLAYNPYCAYNPDFACPIPPKENILDIPISVGEKNYRK